MLVLAQIMTCHLGSLSAALTSKYRPAVVVDRSILRHLDRAQDVSMDIRLSACHVPHLPTAGEFAAERWQDCLRKVPEPEIEKKNGEKRKC